jgi:hypothetical protein
MGAMACGRLHREQARHAVGHQIGKRGMIDMHVQDDERHFGPQAGPELVDDDLIAFRKPQVISGFVDSVKPTDGITAIVGPSARLSRSII